MPLFKYNHHQVSNFKYSLLFALYLIFNYQKSMILYEFVRCIFLILDSFILDKFTVLELIITAFALRVSFRFNLVGSARAC